MIGQSLLESGWLEPVPNTRDGGAVFKDEYVLYQPGVVRNHQVITDNKQLLDEVFVISRIIEVEVGVIS